MIYFFYGSDVEKTRTKAFEWIAKARAKDPNLSYLRLSRGELTPQTLEEVAFSGGLFTTRLLVLIDDPFPPSRAKGAEQENENEDDEKEESGELIETSLTMLADSNNAILILAPKVSAAKAKKISAKAKTEYAFDIRAAKETTRGFNGNLVNALAEKNREKLWLELTRAMRQGDAPEMLHGLLHWKARDLMEKGGRAWSPTEARSASLALIGLLQDSRRGDADLSLSLEQFALSI
jgi:hypothetical protein